MNSRPSTSHTCEPSPRATKYGVPPTDRKARTGELTPPGMTSCARLNSSELLNTWPRSGSRVQHFGDVGRQVGEDDVGSGAFDGGEVLEGDSVTVDPAPLGRR